MDINSQQQINTFVGGMNTDTSDAMLDSSQYRFARNLRIVTNTESNTGELRVIEGTEEFIGHSNWDEILYMTSVRLYGILITRTGVKWAIWRFEKNDSTSLKKIFGDCTEAIWGNDGVCNLSVVTRYESDENIKLYIADGIHQIMILNIYDTPSIVPTDFKILISDLESPIKPLIVQISESAGELKAARVLYAYRLYLKYNSATTLSPLSNLLSLYKDNNSGYEKGAKTGRAVNITIPNETYLHSFKIQIFRINYIENGLQPTVTMILDNDYEAGSNFLDDGSKDINTISISELLSYIQPGIIPEEIETKNNYLFAANIKYSVTDVDKKFKDLEISDFIDIEFYLNGNVNYYTIDDDLQDDDYRQQWTTFRPGETYRFGIIFYDEDGNKSSVFHLKDLTVDEDVNVFGIIESEEIKYKAIPIGVNITQKHSIPDCSQFEIVRCIRHFSDKRTISQGIIGRPSELFKNTWEPISNTNSYYTTKKLSHSGFMSMNSFKMFAQDNLGYEVDYFSKPASKFIQFASPEYCYQPDDIKNLIGLYKNTLTIKTVSEFTANTVDEPETITTHGYTDTMNSKSSIDTLYDDKHPYKFQYYPLSSYYNGLISGDELYIRDTTQYHNFGTTFNIIYPKHYKHSSLTSYNVSDFIFPKTPQWNEMANGDDIICNDAVESIGGYTYYEWSNPFLTLLPNGSGSKLRTMWKDGSYNDVNIATITKSQFPVGSGGKHILIETTTSFPGYYEGYGSEEDHEIVKRDGPFTITIADLRKSANPYGGTTKYAIENSVYSSFGIVLKNNNSLTHSQRFFGDSYIRMFKYNALHSWYSAVYNHEDISKMSTIYCVPIVMDIDLHAQFGTLYTRNTAKPYYLQDEPSAFDGYSQETGAYLYNTAYNQQNDAVQYGAYKEDDDKVSYDVRVHYSEQKTNNEHIDNWTLFKTMNFLEVDSSFGQITDLLLFKDRLVFWQEHATGILAVNERVILQDTNNTQVTLGTGNVLDRYDYISTVYGMKSSQHTACVSNDALYWWDGYNKEILQYTDKYSAAPLSLIKNIKNYLNVEDETENPHSYFDRKYKEVVFSCVGYGSVVYNETLQRFTSVYGDDSKYRVFTKFMPTYSTYIDDTQYITDGLGVYLNNICSNRLCKLFGNDAHPLLKFVVNQNNTVTKTFDIQVIGGELYGGSERIVQDEDNNDVELFQGIDEDSGNHVYHTTNPLVSLFLEYKTPLKQTGKINAGQGITNREYDYRLNVPRETQNALYGGRLRGKTMQCELWSVSNSIDFSLQYITTKYRMSWS